MRYGLNGLRTAVRESPGALRLATVRLAGQFGDGMFQAALSGAILFNPERETDPLAIAGGFAALLLPYSIIGPYAGALLDRWDRRTVLLIANMLRGLLIGVTAASLLAGVRETTLLLLALSVVGVSRFVGAGVSASLPRVLAQQRLVATNSILATVASGCAILGAGISFGIIAVLGAGDTASAVAVALSAAGSVVGALSAAGFRRHTLGPDPDEPAPDPGGPAARSVGTQPQSSLRAIAAGLRSGATAAWHSREVTTAMIGIAAHRAVFGADTLLMVLVLRRGSATSGTGGGGHHIAKFSAAITATGAGMLAAAVIAPILIPRLGRSRTVVAGLLTAIVVQLTLVTPITIANGTGERRAELCLLAAAFLLGLAGQIIKLTGDAAMQIDIDDLHRGQVFALQDTVFNITYVGALAGTALWIPADGRSPAVVIAAAGVYCAGIAAIALISARSKPGDIWDSAPPTA
ncbi:MFS transporter [Nocardia sp. NBC_01503]|uniref:MFS transporter n=1 Tax=Nocardia sp. NBC_01503 TaxID=2975997 RepID=UPI002E7C4F40|nr:MFS transporter [Nocardia sp. NBC_01503]WTL34755.1 MFS transporter [Nocardia sp. NBC_01503]